MSSETVNGIIDRGIKLLERAMSTPQGAGFAMITIGSLIRMTSFAGRPAHVAWVPIPGFVGPVDPTHPEYGGYKQQQIPAIPANAGLDFTVISIDADLAASLTSSTSSALQAAIDQGPGLGVAAGVGSFLGSQAANWLLGILGLKHAQAKQAATKGQAPMPAKVDVTISELLIFGGAVCIGASLANQLIPGGLTGVLK